MTAWEERRSAMEAREEGRSAMEAQEGRRSAMEAREGGWQWQPTQSYLYQFSFPCQKYLLFTVGENQTSGPIYPNLLISSFI